MEYYWLASSDRLLALQTASPHRPARATVLLVFSSRPFQLPFMPRYSGSSYSSCVRPLDGVDLGDLRGDDQARDLEELVRA